MTKSSRAELTFPVNRVHNLLRKGHYANVIRVGSAVYLTAVLEYLAVEVLELAGNAARDNNRKLITPRHISLAIKNDTELEQVLKDVTISQGGVIPFIHSVLLPKKSTTHGDVSKQRISH